MNISPINSNETNFSGRILTKGNWTESLKNTFLENPEVQKMAAGNHDIVGVMSQKRASGRSYRHSKGQPLYKLSITSRPENPSILDRVKEFFGFSPKVKVTDHYHSDIGTYSLMKNRISAYRYKDRLNLSI